MPRATQRTVTLALILALGVSAAMVGCGLAYRPYFDPGGSGASIDEYTYVSEPYMPQSIAVVDTRTGETVFAMDIPVGQQLVINFDDKDVQSDEWMSGVMRWRLMPAGQRYGKLTSRLPVPPPSSRRVDVSLRATPEFPPGDGHATTASAPPQPGYTDEDPVPPPPHRMHEVPDGDTDTPDDDGR